MAKPTVASLTSAVLDMEKQVLGCGRRLDTFITFTKVQAERIHKLEQRLDKAAGFVKHQDVRIVALEAQAEKTRKQLWYLQKIAKGEFKPQAPTQADQPVQEVHEDAPEQAF